MSIIDDMLLKLAPNGVSVVPMWKLTAWDKRFNAVDRSKQHFTQQYTYLLASELKTLAVQDGGTVKLLSTGNDDFGWTTPEIAGARLTTAEIVSIPWGGNPSVQYYNGSFVTADNRIAVVQDPTVLSTKFLYYVMLSRLDEIRHFYRGAGIQHPNMAKVLDMKIPVPPIQVQNEIVRILDLFTELDRELQAELRARELQYYYYRNLLLTFSDESNAQRVFLGDVATIGTGSRDTQDATPDGDFVFYARGRDPLRLSTFDFDEQAIITAGDGVGVGKVFHFASGKYALHQRAYRIVPNADVDPRYLYHYIVSNFSKYLEQTSVHASVTSLRRPMFLRFPITVPTLEEQKRIAALLDKFDAIISDARFGIPTEIDARQTQYQYYRNKLLTFKEAVA